MATATLLRVSLNGQTTTPNATGGFTTTNPYDVSNYLDPSMAFTMANGLRSLNSNQAASGQLSSGNSLKDILGYSQGLASTNYNNAVGQAQNDRNFGYNVALNDQTIPFNQQLQLAQLGMRARAGRRIRTISTRPCKRNSQWRSDRRRERVRSAGRIRSTQRSAS